MAFPLLNISPSQLEFLFDADQELKSVLTFRSVLEQTRTAFKIKTTNSDRFVVCPPSGIIEPGTSRVIRVYLKAPSRYEEALKFSRDRFLVQSIAVGNDMDEKDISSNLFKSRDRQEAKLKVVVSAPLAHSTVLENEIRAIASRQGIEGHRAVLRKFSELLLARGVISQSQVALAFSTVGEIFQNMHGVTRENAEDQAKTFLNFMEGRTNFKSQAPALPRHNPFSGGMLQVDRNLSLPPKRRDDEPLDEKSKRALARGLSDVTGLRSNLEEARSESLHSGSGGTWERAHSTEAPEGATKLGGSRRSSLSNDMAENHGRQANGIVQANHELVGNNVELVAPNDTEKEEVPVQADWKKGNKGKLSGALEEAEAEPDAFQAFSDPVSPMPKFENGIQDVIEIAHEREEREQKHGKARVQGHQQKPPQALKSWGSGEDLKDHPEFTNKMAAAFERAGTRPSDRLEDKHSSTADKVEPGKVLKTDSLGRVYSVNIDRIGTPAVRKATLHNAAKLLDPKFGETSSSSSPRGPSNLAVPASHKRHSNSSPPDAEHGSGTAAKGGLTESHSSIKSDTSIKDTSTKDPSTKRDPAVYIPSGNTAMKANMFKSQK